MADTKISALPAATTPLAGTEVLPIVQSSTTDKVSVANLTAGRDVSGLSFTGGNAKISGNQIAATDTNGNMTVLANGSGHLGLGATVSGFALSGIPLDIRDGYRVYDSNSSSFGLRLTFSSNIPTFQGYRETVGATNINLQPLGGDVNFGAGNLIQGTAAKGVNFTANTPAAGMTSQLLNWYEEGTWTPIVATGITTPTYVTQTGTYTRIGNTVFIRCYLSVNGGTTNGGGLTIGGLPFTPGAYAGFSGSFAYIGGGMQQSAATDALPVIQVSDAVYFYKTTGSSFAGTDLTSSTFRVDFTANYTI